MPSGHLQISVRFLGEVDLVRENYGVFSLNPTNWVETKSYIAKILKMVSK